MKYIILFSLIIAGCTTIAEDSNICTGNVCTEPPEDEYIKIPLSDITTDVEKYTYDTGDTIVTYLVALGTDNEIRTAFDACDVCGGSLGYSQRGQDVVCDKCGKFFKIDDIGSKNGPGGCWPSFLDNSIQDGYVLISKADLETGAYRFR